MFANSCLTSKIDKTELSIVALRLEGLSLHDYFIIMELLASIRLQHSDSAHSKLQEGNTKVQVVQ